MIIIDRTRMQVTQNARGSLHGIRTLVLCSFYCVWYYQNLT